MANNTPSMYSELWETIKKDDLIKPSKGVRISALPILHPRIIRAVQKRKVQDTAFQFINDEADKGHCRLVATCKGSIITFKLKYSLSLGDL